MLSGDSGQGESICTPRSVSKRLFGASGSSSKRSLFGRSDTESRKETDLSAEDSDLGPMSPLAMTDRSESSRESSPGRSYGSPLRTPEKSPRTNSSRAWDRLRPNSGRSENRMMSFDALKTSTRAARSSPKRKIFSTSPKSLSSTPRRKNSWIIGTPEREMALLFQESIIPETPKKKDENEINDEEDRVDETPEKKKEKEENRLVTPLNCFSNEIAAPRLHRRRSCLLDNEKTRSPDRIENILKRRADDNLQKIGTKIPKMDDNLFFPKARASLFPEMKGNDTPPKDFSLSTKSFYKSSLEKRGRSIGNIEWPNIEKAKKRHSLPSSMSNHTYHRRPIRKSNTKRKEMNAGVRHGIKKPQPKKHVSRIEAFKENTEKLDVRMEEERANERIVDNDSKITESKNLPSPSSPISDPNKRFFKTNRTLKSHHVATVTVNDKIKLKVSDGKIALNEKKSSKNYRKKPRLEDMSFDTTDLTVDEPNFDISMEKKNVDNILKVLEDDWANDEYDTMDTLTILSPIRTNQTGVLRANEKDVTMSPASVLSNMTLSMNIEDSTSSKKESQDNAIKLYPLFEKGFSSNFVDEDGANKKKNDRGLKRSWQTSSKAGGAEDQYQIDAGQKKFGASACKECGIVYQLGDPEDENTHLNYHNNFKTLKFNGWKNERVIITDPFTNSRIIGIEPGDSKQCWKKVEQVLAVVDKDLGLADMEVSNYFDKKIYFYVRDKTIIGVMVAESIKTAHRMIPEFAELNCCSAEETPAKCGVNVVWTAMSHRRQHIATKLLDTLRTTYFFGYIMTLEDIAFSMPTPTGKIFAEKYTKTRNFKVYS